MVPSTRIRAASTSWPVGDLVTAAVVLAAIAAIPFFVESRYVLGQIILALFLSTIASQWNLLFGYSGVFSLGQMAIFGVGGYATAMLCVYFGLGIWAAMPLGAVAAVLFSLVIGAACLRLSGVYVALLTLAIAQALYVLIVTDTECFRMVGSACRQFTGGAVGFARFGDLGMRAWLRAKWLVGDYAVVAALFGVTMLCTYAIINSPIGLAFRAIKDNPGYAVARGVNRFGAQLLVFGLRPSSPASRAGSMRRISRPSAPASCRCRSCSSSSRPRWSAASAASGGRSSERSS